MNKLFKCLSTAVLGIAMAVGVGVGVASGVKTGEVKADYQLVYENNCPKSASNSSYTGYYTSTINDITWYAPGNQYENQAWRIGGKTKTTYDRVLYTKSAIDSDIKRIEFITGANTLNKLNSIRLDVYSTQSGAEDGGSGSRISSINTDLKASSTIIFDHPSADSSWSNVFYRFTLNVTGSSTSAQFIKLTGIKFYTESSGPTTYTVSFNTQGHGTAPEQQKGIEKGGKVTKPADPTEENYNFGGWFKETGCTNEWDFDTDTVNDNLTLYAKWTGVDCSVSFSVNGGKGTAPSTINTHYNEKINLPTGDGLSMSGFKFGGWNTKNDGTGDNYLGGAQYTVKGSLTLYAKWNELGATYKLLTSADDLQAGDSIAIASKSTSTSGSDTIRKVLSTTQNSNNRSETSVTIEGDTFTATDGVQEIVLGKTNDNWTFSVKSDSATGYLYAASSGSNHLKTQKTNDANGEWTISIGSDDSVATIKAQGENSRNLIKYNSSSNIFSCYSSGQGDVVIYKKVVSAAGTYADTFLNSGLCGDGQGKTAPSTEIWGNLATEFAKLSESDRAIFKDATADEDGTNIERCVARYDLVVSKYGKTTYTDFMNRDPQPTSGVSILPATGVDNNILMIVVISVVSVTALGGYFFIRRRKENH